MSLGGIQTPMKPVDMPLVQQKHSGMVCRVIWHKDGRRMLQTVNDEGNTFTVEDSLFELKWEPYGTKPKAADDAPAVPKPAGKRKSGKKSGGK